MYKKGEVYQGDSLKVGKKSNNPLGILPNSLDEQILADALEDGFSIRRAQACVNRNRREIDPDAVLVGYAACRTAIRRLNPDKSGLFYMQQ